MNEPAFIICPDDWVGSIIEMWDDGEMMLTSGLFSHERHARGERPVKTMQITGGTTRSEILAWLERARLFVKRKQRTDGA